MSCNGSCCAVFYYPSSPEQLRERIDQGEAHDDDPYIADMLIPLTLEQARERAERFGIREPTYVNNGDNVWTEETRLYTCRHWDEDTRLCTAYADRPLMCMKYPYEQICEHCGWTNTAEQTPIDRLLGGGSLAAESKH